MAARPPPELTATAFLDASCAVRSRESSSRSAAISALAASASARNARSSGSSPPADEAGAPPCCALAAAAMESVMRSFILPAGVGGDGCEVDPWCLLVKCC